MTIDDIILRYEIPREFHKAVWSAYEEGLKRGYITASLA